MTSSFTESRSFFDVQTSARKVSLLQTQIDPSTPSVDGLERSTNLLIPDYLTSARFEHFPADLYDLRPHSHLVRFMRALMGDSGAGAMRKRFLIARFQQAFTSTHFYDLDRFYGAIFNTTRFQAEQLPINPFTDTATGDEWDRIHLSDAQFRERVFALAKAIPMGATVPGLKTAAEAITGAPCEVYERWRDIDYAHGHGYLTRDDYQGHSYREVEGFGTYADVALLGTYENVNGTPPDNVTVPRRYQNFDEDGYATYLSAQGAPLWRNLEERTIDAGPIKNDRGAFVVRPLKTYAGGPAGLSERAQDEQALRRVLNVLKPASARLVIDMTGTGLYTERPINAVYADSEYYEIIQRINPSNSLLAPTYPLSRGQVKAGIDGLSDRPLPRPPFSATQDNHWNYANEVVAVRSYAENDAQQIIDGNDFDRVADIYGNVTDFSGEKGVLDPHQAEAGRLSSDTSLVSHPYAADRRAVLVHE